MDSSGNEETQNQYEREDLKYQETEEKEKPKITQQIQTPQWGEDEEDPEEENLYKSETVYKKFSADKICFFSELISTSKQVFINENSNSISNNIVYPSKEFDLIVEGYTKIIMEVLNCEIIIIIIIIL